MDRATVKEAKNAYQREWYKKNKGKAKEYNERYWAKKAKQMKDQQQEESTS